jgi:16S rRNA processing protein RimM
VAARSRRGRTGAPRSVAPGRRAPDAGSAAPSDARAARRVCVAQIGAAHGIRGEVRLKPFTADPLAVADYGPLESEDGRRRFEVVALRAAKDTLIARFAGVDERTAAEALTHMRLYVPRERLPPLDEEDTYYHADLIGLAAVDKHGTVLGAVQAVHNFGAGDVIEVKPADGAAMLLPFTREAVPEIDLAAGRLVVDPPEGFLGGPRRAAEAEE